MYVYVCMCVYVYVYVYIYIYMYMCVYMYVCVCMCIYVCVCIYIYICIYIRTDLTLIRLYWLLEYCNNMYYMFMCLSVISSLLSSLFYPCHHLGSVAVKYIHLETYLLYKYVYKLI